MSMNDGAQALAPKSLFNLVGPTRGRADPLAPVAGHTATTIILILKPQSPTRPRVPSFSQASKRQRPPSNLKYAFTALPTFPSTNAALASLSHAPHAVQLWTPTVDPPLAAHGRRASWTTESPCTVLFRPRPGHDTSGPPWVRGLSGADLLVGSEETHADPI